MSDVCLWCMFLGLELSYQTWYPDKTPREQKPLLSKQTLEFGPRGILSWIHQTYNVTLSMHKTTRNAFLITQACLHTRTQPHRR